MRLSKSKYLLGLQCHQQLWNAINRPERIAAPDRMTERIFAQGHAIGEFAKARYPGGYEIPFGRLDRTVKRTKDVLSGFKPLFEASFSRGEAYCRVDVLVPRDGVWDIIEVKSSTRVKDVHLEDVAFQRWVVSNTIPVGRCYLMHVNRDYVRDGAIEPLAILALEEITEDVEKIVPLVEARVDSMLEMLDGPEPDVAIGTHCTSPYECPLIPYCWAEVPDDGVFEFYRIRSEDAFARYHAGERRMLDVPAEDLNEKQRIQQETARTGERHVDRVALQRWLETLEEPITCLDFETASSGIPFASGMRPYDQIVFQYSAHVLDSGIEHHEVLSEDEDPRRVIATGLLDLPERGTVLAHNASFEKRVIKDLAQRYPDLRERLMAIHDRIEDLIVPFQRFWFYDPKQKGSCSMKAILPALGIADYSELDIGSGDLAAMEWERLVSDTEPAEKQHIRESLLEYCRLDTLGMVRILEALRAEASNTTS